MICHWEGRGTWDVGCVGGGSRLKCQHWSTVIQTFINGPALTLREHKRQDCGELLNRKKKRMGSLGQPCSSIVGHKQKALFYRRKKKKKSQLVAYLYTAKRYQSCQSRWNRASKFSPGEICNWPCLCIKGWECPGGLIEIEAILPQIIRRRDAHSVCANGILNYTEGPWNKSTACHRDS